MWRLGGLPSRHTGLLFLWCQNRGVTSPRLLVLWDIDHTLIEAWGSGRKAYERAFPVAFGRELEQLAGMLGRTELRIAAETIALHGIEATSEATTRLMAALAQTFEDDKTELFANGRALPGAREALSAFAEDPAVHQGVLTGNLPGVARLKLEAFRLDHYLNLDASAYGDDHEDRTELVAVARQRAESVGLGFDDTVLIGDTPRDVIAGLESGARVVAVATGRCSADDLRDAGATVVLRDLTDLAEVTASVLGR